MYNTFYTPSIIIAMIEFEIHKIVYLYRVFSFVFLVSCLLNQQSFELECTIEVALSLLQVWSVLTSGKDHGAVPRRIKAFVCCYSKLL